MKKLPSVRAVLAVIVFILISFALVKGADESRKLTNSSTIIENEYNFTCNANSSTMKSEVESASEEISLASNDTEVEEETEARPRVYLLT